MKPKLFLFLSIILLSFYGCESPGNAVDISIGEDDYLIFGHYYGKCSAENCIEIFRLEKDQLLEDTKDQYPSGFFYNGDFVNLSQEKYEKTKDLIHYFPIELLDETNNRIGHPDEGDWGGYYVEYKKGDVRKCWLLDTKKENVPEKYHDFIDIMNKKINSLL